MKFEDVELISQSASASLIHAEGCSSLGASVMNLVKAMTGAAILCLPYAIGQTGLFLGIGLLLLTAVVQFVALHLLGLCVLHLHHQGQHASFRALASMAFKGSKTAEIVVQLSIALGSFGFGTNNLSVAGGLLPQVLEYLGTTDGLLVNRRFWITVIGWVVGLPLMCLQKLDSLKFTSFIGNIAVMYIIVVLCLFATGIVTADPVQQDVSFLPPPETEFTSLPGIIECLPVYISAFACAQQLPTIIFELQKNTVRRVNALLASAIGITCAIFGIIGVCGSLALGASVDGNLLLSFPSKHGTAGALVATVARFAIAVNVTGSVPLFMHPTRIQISQLLFQKGPEELGRVAWTSITFGLFVASWGAACFIGSLDVAMALVGCTSGVLVGFTFPAMFYCRMMSSQPEKDGLAVGTAKIISVVSIMLIPILLWPEIYKMSRQTK